MSEALAYALDDARARFYEPGRSDFLAAQKAAHALRTPKVIAWERKHLRERQEAAQAR